MHKPTETENKNRNGREEVQSDLLHELPDWLQEFRENLVDERSPSEPRGNSEAGYRDTFSSSHELPMESRAKVEPGSVMWTEYPHTAYFLMHFHTCVYTTLWLKVSTCLIVRCFSLFRLLPLFRVSLPFVHSLHLLCPAHHLPCGRNRRGLKPLHSRTMRSIRNRNF